MSSSMPEVSAREILKLLQLGKTVTVTVATPVEFSNLRSRLATLKSKEDEVAVGIGMYDEGEIPSLNCECRPTLTPAMEIDGVLTPIYPATGYECTFRFGIRPEAKKYSIVSVD